MKKKKSFIKRLKDTPPREHFAVLLFLVVFSTLLFFANKHWGAGDFFIFSTAKSIIGWIIGFVFWAFFFLYSVCGYERGDSSYYIYLVRFF